MALERPAQGTPPLISALLLPPHSPPLSFRFSSLLFKPKHTLLEPWILEVPSNWSALLDTQDQSCDSFWPLFPPRSPFWKSPPQS